MRVVVALVLLCLCALPASAQSLRGQWDVVLTNHPAYRGVVLIDAEHRATWDAPNDNARPAKFKGYVSADGPRAQIILTDKSTVTKIQCAIQSSDLLHCHSFLADGQISDLIVLTRVGPGPSNLTLVPR